MCTVQKLRTSSLDRLYIGCSSEDGYGLDLFRRALGAGILPRRGPKEGGVGVRSSAARSEGGPNGPSRPLYFSRLSGANSTQSFGKDASPHSPSHHRSEAALLLLILLSSHIVTDTHFLLVMYMRPKTDSMAGACGLPDAGRTPTDASAITCSNPPANQPRISPHRCLYSQHLASLGTVLTQPPNRVRASSLDPLVS